MAYPPLGVQLIIFTKEANIEKDTEAVLDAVKASGFRAIEGGVTMSADNPERFKAMLDERGLVVAGLHGGLDQDLDQTLRLMKIYDTRDLCISGIGGWDTPGVDRCMRDIEAMNEMGKRCLEHGVFLHYHNHAYEFAPVDEGASAMDLILTNMDMSVVDLCVDVAWVRIGGHDPAIFLRKHAESVGYVHLKDYVGDRHWVELGYGVVPLDSVIKAMAKLPRVRWTVYEQDTTERAAAESCAISFNYLRDAFGYQ
jgi:sugar phosphate isomerase/epimerase